MIEAEEGMIFIIYMSDMIGRHGASEHRQIGQCRIQQRGIASSCRNPFRKLLELLQSDGSLHFGKPVICAEGRMQPTEHVVLGRLDQPRSETRRVGKGWGRTRKT